MRLPHLLRVYGERGGGVEHNHAAAGVSVYEVGAIALPQGVQGRGLIEVPQGRKVLATVELGRVRLKNS